MSEAESQELQQKLEILNELFEREVKHSFQSFLLFSDNYPRTLNTKGT